MSERHYTGSIGPSILVSVEDGEPFECKILRGPPEPSTAEPAEPDEWDDPAFVRAEMERDLRLFNLMTGQGISDGPMPGQLPLI